MRIAILVALFGLVTSLRRSSSKSQSNFIFRRRRSRAVYGNTWKQHFEGYMSALKQTSNPDGFDSKCEPYIQEPRGESKGLVVLQHGFTSCAGFWYLQAPPLVEQGWTVMVPTLTGHGRKPKVERNGSGYTVTDYTADFPEWEDKYEEYSNELIDISLKYQQENPSKKMVFTGCSHGGAIASYVVMNMEPGTWDRVLLMNPFLSAPTGLGADFGISVLRDFVPLALPVFKFIKDKVSWGEDCDRRSWPNDPRTRGVGASCQFTLENLRGVLRFANNVEGEARARAAKKGVFTGGIIDRAVGVAQLVKHVAWQFATGSQDAPPSNLKVQLIATEGDGAVSNSRIHFAAAALKEMVKSSNSGFCALAPELEHTYINPIDKPLGSDLWWLDSNRVQGGRNVIERLNDFITKGTLFPTRGLAMQDRLVEGDPQCDVRQRR